MEFNYLDTQQQRKFLKFNSPEAKSSTDKLFSNKSQLITQKLPPIDQNSIHYQHQQHQQQSFNKSTFKFNDPKDMQENFYTPVNSNQTNKNFASRIPKIPHNYYKLPDFSKITTNTELISPESNHFRNKSIASRTPSNQILSNQPQLNTSRTHKFQHELELAQSLEYPPLNDKTSTMQTPVNNPSERRSTNQNLKAFRQQYNSHKPTNIQTENSLPSYQRISGFISPRPPKIYMASDILDQMFTFKMPDLMPSKLSNKKNGIVKAFAANTHQGLIRNYNEDRVSIILNMLKPQNKQLLQGQTWPNCQFFGIYDGHGGNKCAEFLKENLHQYIISDKNFPSNPEQAIMNACLLAESTFITKASNEVDPDRSGSCATFILIVEDICYSGNVGDSRIIASAQLGNQHSSVTIDHKPNFENEKKRIMDAGGHIYQTQAPKIAGISLNGGSILGPHRVFPGRLSVLIYQIYFTSFNRFLDLSETWRQNYLNMVVFKELQQRSQKLLPFLQQISWISQSQDAMEFLINQQMSKFLMLFERKQLRNKHFKMCIPLLEMQQ